MIDLCSSAPAGTARRLAWAARLLAVLLGLLLALFLYRLHREERALYRNAVVVGEYRARMIARRVGEARLAFWPALLACFHVVSARFIL